jgi:RHS repeat-associated protein
MEQGYDQAGDVTIDVGAGNQYLYDGDGRICAVASPNPLGGTTLTGYLYDAGGTRVAKGNIAEWSCDPATSGLTGSTTTNDYILGLSGEQFTEMGVDANHSLVWQHTNVWAGGKLLATYDGATVSGKDETGGLHFYFDDPLGSRRVQTDYAGNIEKTCSSLPYGDAESCAPTPTENLFTGKERDSESGNDYFGARYYASSMGRFMSPDWSAKEEPVPYAKLDDPQTLNLYAYVGNNPLTRVDADGHVVSSSCANDSKCSITVKVNVILDKNAKLTKADWKAFQKDFLGKAQKDFGNSNIKLDYTYTNGSVKDDGSSGTGMKSGYLNFFVTDKQFGGPDGGSKTSPGGLTESYINIKGLGEGGGPSSTNWTSVIVPLLADSNVFEHELGQQFLGTQSSRTYAQDLMRQDKIDNTNTFQGWGLGSSSYRTGLEPASFAAPTNPEQ